MAFLARHEDEPFDAPPEPALPEVAPDGDAAWLAMLGRMAPAERDHSKQSSRNFSEPRENGAPGSPSATPKVSRPRGSRGQDLAAGIEALHGVDTDEALSAVRAVLTHGVKEFDLSFNPASGLADNRDVGEPAAKAWTEEEAIKILKATFEGSSKDHSEPHRRAIFWVPWIAAYTGLRATEMGQFRGRHPREDDGIPYLFITPADGSTRGGKAWAVGIHTHLIELGFLDCIRVVGEGPLFYDAYPTGTDLTALKGKHRGTETGKRVGQWITGLEGIKAPLGRPLHAFRHLFTTRLNRHSSYLE